LKYAYKRVQIFTRVNHYRRYIRGSIFVQ